MSPRGGGRIGGRALLQLHSGRPRASRLHRLRGVGEGPWSPNHQPLVSQLLVVEFGVAGPPSCRGWPVGCSTRGSSRLITASRRGCAGLSRARRAVALGVAPGAPCLLMRWKRRAVALDVANRASLFAGALGAARGCLGFVLCAGTVVVPAGAQPESWNGARVWHPGLVFVGALETARGCLGCGNRASLFARCAVVAGVAMFVTESSSGLVFTPSA